MSLALLPLRLLPLPLGVAARCGAAGGPAVGAALGWWWWSRRVLEVRLAAPSKLLVRQISILHELAPNKNSRRNPKRVGRGPASGYGKTSGRGHKGTGQRGKVKSWFQSGQTPLIVTHGRKGEDNLFALDLAPVNLNRIQQWIDNGRLDPAKPITPKELIDCGLAKIKDGIKILASTRHTDTASNKPSLPLLRQPITVVASRASLAAIAAVEAAGGRIVTRYYTRKAIQLLVRGESKHSELPLPLGAEHLPAALAAAGLGRRLYRLPDPTSRRDIEYYRDPAHRGYLSSRLAPGESPSLFHRVPLPSTDEDQLRNIAARKLRRRQSLKGGMENTMLF